MSDESSIYGTNTRGEAILRTSENAEGDPTSIYGVNSDGKACMRVSSDVTSNDPTSIYGVNGSGEACVRIEGSGGGGGTGSFIGVSKNVDANGVLRNGSSIIDLSSVKKVASDVLAYAYRKNTEISGTVDMSNIEVIEQDGCIYAFNTAIRITSVDLSRLVASINTGCQNMFNNASSLSTALLLSFKTVGNCQNMFAKTILTNLSFPAMQSVSSSQNLSSILNGVTGCTMHFPSNMQSTVESLTNYPNFGGTNTTVLFDLPATVILTGANSTEYERSPKDDTATALAWRVKDTGTPLAPVIDWTPFYTSGTTNPTIGDTIYSDSACTTPVTTISSIV